MAALLRAQPPHFGRDNRRAVFTAIAEAPGGSVRTHVTSSMQRQRSHRNSRHFTRVSRVRLMADASQQVSLQLSAASLTNSSTSPLVNGPGLLARPISEVHLLKYCATLPS